VHVAALAPVAHVAQLAGHARHEVPPEARMYPVEHEQPAPLAPVQSAQPLPHAVHVVVPSP
jgi:hypothetical protein